MGFADFPADGGRGGIALRDVEAGFLRAYPCLVKVTILRKGTFYLPFPATRSSRREHLPYLSSSETRGSSTSLGPDGLGSSYASCGREWRQRPLHGPAIWVPPNPEQGLNLMH